jgi:hypothetical protein
MSPEPSEPRPFREERPGFFDQMNDWAANQGGWGNVFAEMHRHHREKVDRECASGKRSGEECDE